MKAGIHPKYKEITITCMGCKTVIKTRSTKTQDFSVDVCSSCHPFYTGRQKYVDSAGRIERFQQKWARKGKAGAAEEKKAEAPKAAAKPVEAPKPAEAPKAEAKPVEAPKPEEKPAEAPKAEEKPAEAPKAEEKPEGEKAS